MEKEIKSYEEGENVMTDSSLNATEIAVGSLLAGGRGGMGGNGGAWGGGYDGFAGPTANAIRIESGNKASASGLENLLDQNQFTATNKNIDDGFSRAADTRASNVNRVSDSQFRSELRQTDQSNQLFREIASNARVMDKCCCDTQKAIADAAKDAAKCCCEAQLAACKSHAEITATVLADGAKTREMIRGDALVVANAKITQLETINALSHHCVA